MDYEQKYNDALERARKLKENPKAIFFEEKNVHVSDYIFPELAESEDEKIRKAILNYMTIMWGNSQDDVCGVHVEDAIAWLEKQGEQQNSLKIAKFKVGDTLCRKGYTDHIVTNIYDKCEIPVYICKTDEGERYINFTDQEKWQLKHHWKPSEEQMKAFEHFIRSIGESGYASPYDNNTKLVYSLFNDLKKL